MLNLPRVGLAVGLTLGAAAGVAGAGALVALRRPLPRVAGKVQLAGLTAEARVVRDRWGVPHIYAGNNADLFAAMGYVHAQDRLWQMELNRRMAHGQLAEIFGPIALSSDRFIRTLGFSRIARREQELLDGATRTVIEAYVRGVNACLAANRRQLPIEFSVLRYTPRPWEVIDVLIWAKVMALSLSTNWTNELFNAQVVARLGAERARELLPGYPADHPIAVPAGITYSSDVGAGALQAASAAAPFIRSVISGHGSNAWALSGTQTRNGRPLLANDTHLGLTIPGIWYENHLEGGDYSVAGFSFPGVPAVVVGHNARIAWGITNGLVDVQDLYIEHFDPHDPLRYRWQTGWETAELVQEEIRVKGRAAPEVEAVRITRHGPVVSAVTAPEDSRLRFPTDRSAGNGHATVREELALRWTALEPSVNVFRAALALNRAGNWDEFCAALNDWDVPPQNFVYADVDGHIGYRLSGKLPIRAQGDGKLPVPGWSGEYEWTGYIPPAALPAAYDPPAGLVVTANHRVAGAGYAYADALRGEWWNGYRAARITTLLAAQAPHNAETCAQIQRDQYSIPGVELAQVLAGLPLHDRLELQVRDIMAAWDGQVTPESAAAAIYDTLRYYLERAAFVELGDLINAPASMGAFGVLPSNDFLRRNFPTILARIKAAAGPERADPWLGGERTWNDVLHTALQQTVADLRARLGPNPHNWRFGRIHGLMLRHVLGNVPTLGRIFNRGPWPYGGDSDTVCMGYIPRDTAVGPTYHAPSQRLICDPGDWDATQAILPAGQSGHPGSPHYSNMNIAWRRGVYHPLLWSRALVEKQSVATLILAP